MRTQQTVVVHKPGGRSHQNRGADTVTLDFQPVERRELSYAECGPSLWWPELTKTMALAGDDQHLGQVAKAAVTPDPGLCDSDSRSRSSLRSEGHEFDTWP